MIGRKGRLPWDIPEDWEYFLKQTREGTLIFGRRCYEEMIERTKEGRQAIVLSRDPSFQPKFGHKAGSIPEALENARGFGKEIWICGGEQIYQETLPMADRLFLTLVHADVEGDTHFPDWEPYFPNETSRKDSHNPNYRYSFMTYTKSVA